MIYLILIIIFLLILFISLATNKHSRQSNLWILLLGFYISSCMLFIIYLSKDLAYFSRFNQYFNLPNDLWYSLIKLNISKEWVIRLLNLSCVLFIFTNALFCGSFLKKSNHHYFCIVKRFLVVILTAEFLLYDPLVYKMLYRFLYPQFIDISLIDSIMNGFCAFTIYLNLSILVGCVITLLITTIKSPNIKFMKYIMISVTTSYVLLVISYTFILSWAPTLLIKYSKAANFTRYKTVSLNGSPIFYTVFPYIVTTLLIIGIYSIFKYTKAKAEFLNQDVHILRTIDAATVTSRIFCHYMKNELLALSAELENLEPSSNNTPIIESVMQRCDTLYERLNHIHKSSTDATLTLMKQDIYPCIQNAVATVTNTKKLDNIDLIYSLPDKECMALIDTYYLEQSLANMIFNAAEAITKAPKEHHYIHISISQNNKWIYLSIKDNGIGIKHEDLSNIFTPFYSTNPITQNWGIGLSLAYKIITAHEGKLTVQSEYGLGTTFEILLPNATF